MPKNSGSIEKNVCRVDSLTVYEVKEEELDILSKWPSVRYNWLFDISILFFWFFVSNIIVFFTWLWAEDWEKRIILISIISSCLFISIITFLLWLFVKKENTFAKIYKKIIERHTID